ncbi:MAG: hypothetical protein INQ03_00790 [Candidatus Heimdallarchaeota archaeon]|nr:hypothetical protein [Candidatus Heimdallarchaeota archaeon]
MEFTATVTHKQRETMDTHTLTLQTPEDFHWQLGQFIMVRAEIDGVSVKRAYTISSSPTRKILQITVKQTDSPTMSKYLNEIEVGNQIDVKGPYGAQHDAKYCIWIAESFRPGHLEAIRILNESSLDKNRYYFPIKLEIVSIENSKKVISFSIASTDYEMPLSGGDQENKPEFRSRKAIYWQFFDQIVSELQEFDWFPKSKSTENSYLEYSSGIKSEHVNINYGFRFPRGKRFQVIINFWEKNQYWKTEGYEPKSLMFIDPVYELIESLIDRIPNVTKSELAKDVVERRVYNIITISYPKEYDFNNENHLSNIANWATAVMVALKNSIDLELEKLVKLIDSEENE